jgi:hypothetical protein
MRRFRSSHRFLCDILGLSLNHPEMMRSILTGTKKQGVLSVGNRPNLRSTLPFDICYRIKFLLKEEKRICL